MQNYLGAYQWRSGDEGWEIFSEDRRYYYDCLMAPTRVKVETALDKLSRSARSTFMPLVFMGPLVRYALIELTQTYRTWASNLICSPYFMPRLMEIQQL